MDNLLSLLHVHFTMCLLKITHSEYIINDILYGTGVCSMIHQPDIIKKDLMTLSPSIVEVRRHA